MKIKDQFEISGGNLKTLILLPEMMSIPKWREQLRDLAMRYMMEKYPKTKYAEGSK